MDFLNSWIVPPEAANRPGAYIATALAAFLFTAVSKGGFGGGAGIVSVPLMLQVAPVSFVLGMWLPVLIACDIATIRSYPKEWNPRAFTPLLPGIFLGIIWAAVFFQLTSVQTPSAENKKLEAWVKLGVALISCVFVAMQMRPKRAVEGEPWQPSWRSSLPVGVIAGVTTMVAHAAGPVVTMFLLPQKLEQRVFVGTTGRFFFLVNSIKVPFMILVGLITLVTFKYGLWLILLAPLGVGLGAWLNRRINAAWFMRIVYVSLVFAALKLASDAAQTIGAHS